MHHQIGEALGVDVVVGVEIGSAKEFRNHILVEFLGFDIVALVQQVDKMSLEPVDLGPGELQLEEGFVEGLPRSKNSQSHMFSKVVIGPGLTPPP